jgi:hypothetical protein
MDYASQKPAAAHVSQPIFAGSISEGIVGAGAVALAILGLIGIYPSLLLEIAVIVIGAAFLIEGMTVAARFSRLLTDTGSFRNNLDITGGMNAEFFGGITGVTLGILALLGVAPAILLSVSAIVFGATLIASGSLSTRVSDYFGTEDPKMSRIAQEASKSSGSAEILAGLGAITLGVLALLGTLPLTLNLVSMLVIGSVILLSGSAIGSKIFGR